MPTIYIIAGPNGAGKTTFADRYLPDEAKQLEFVNADSIARGLAPYDPDSAAIEAGRIVLRRIRTLIGQKVGFTYETTMSGKTALFWLEQAQRTGFALKAGLPVGTQSRDDYSKNSGARGGGRAQHSRSGGTPAVF